MGWNPKKDRKTVLEQETGWIFCQVMLFVSLCSGAAASAFIDLPEKHVLAISYTECRHSDPRLVWKVSNPSFPLESLD